MPRPVIKLTDFDPQPIVEYAITHADLANIYRYLQVMQAQFSPGTWDEICLGGYYGASALLHEVVELRILLDRDPYLLTRSDSELKTFARHPSNSDAHVRGLEVEYCYLQSIIQHSFNVHMDIGALLKANSQRPGDWYDLFETDLPFFEPTSTDVHNAKLILGQLRMTKGRKQ